MRQAVHSERTIKTFLPHFSSRKANPRPIIHFNDGPVVENPSDGEPIKVRFMLADHCEYETSLAAGEWAKADKKFAGVWRVEISDSDGLLRHSHIFDPVQKKVRINIDSRSLGDTLAWIPQIETYKKAHPDTKVFVSHFWPSLGFESKYPELHFIDPGQQLDDCYATYNLGFFFDELTTRHPHDPRTVPLAKVASDILGIAYKESRPRIKVIASERVISGPYVCIATASTANCKHWLYEGGWQFVVDQLREMGFSVVVIQKEPTSLKNVIDQTGDAPIKDRIGMLHHCEFFIGLGSGLSWLAWAVEKPVVMISGFSAPFAEFRDRCYRVSNAKVCTACWNDTTYKFDRDDWNWCPRHADTGRQFECSRLITPTQVMAQVVRLLTEKRAEPVLKRRIFRRNQPLRRSNEQII